MGEMETFFFFFSFFLHTDLINTQNTSLRSHTSVDCESRALGLEEVQRATHRPLCLEVLLFCTVDEEGI